MTSTPLPGNPSVVGVGIILVRNDGKVLLGHRIREAAPSWCLPGGRVERGEDFETAALRELAEEAGVEGVRGARVFGVALDPHAGVVRVTAGVIARIEAAVPRNLEPAVFDQWIWASPSDLPAPLFPASEALLAAWRGAPPAAGWTWYPVLPANLMRAEVG